MWGTEGYKDDRIVSAGSSFSFGVGRRYEFPQCLRLFFMKIYGNRVGRSQLRSRFQFPLSVFSFPPASRYDLAHGALWKCSSVRYGFILRVNIR